MEIIEAADVVGFSGINTVWVLVAAALVFLMQAGFAMVETGFTRAKNAGNIIMKNLMDFCIGTPLYWLTGFGIMFAGSSGLVGGLDFMIRGDYSATLPSGVPLWAFVVFQTVFCATAATIVSGAMAERTKFSAYCIYSAAISALIYPVSGHWIWGGGWLAQLGFHDFAGSTAVHMVGGLSALIGAAILGPRIGKYNNDGKANAIPGHSITLGALGVFILWFCWFGFNGGSTVNMEGESIVSAGRIFMTTNMAAAVAACVTMAFTWIKYKKPDVSMTLNGALAGLVAITAGCDVVSPLGSFIIGAISGVVIVLGVEFVDQKLKIDDPVGAVGVHCICGSLGTVLVGFFALDGGLLYGGGFKLLGVQLLGVLSVAAWVTVTMLIVFNVIKKTIGLRVEPEVEIQGLDKTEHALASAYADFMPVSAMSVLPAVNERIQTVEDEIREKAYPSGQTKEGAVLTKVTILFNPLHLDKMKDAMNAIGVTGMTVTSVVGCGLQKGKTDYYRGVKIETLDLLPKVQMDIVVSSVPVDKVVETASSVLHTGRIGDGKIFISHIEDAVKISTGERGYSAMQGTDV
ncbi:MAG: ammonium transporter [Oscillospiraceae bacterium]|jgi:Amt family ammonium transporter|nr:ammonium transporter [Oscillospiraceae bacterium]